MRPFGFKPVADANEKAALSRSRNIDTRSRAQHVKRVFQGEDLLEDFSDGLEALMVVPV